MYSELPPLQQQADLYPSQLFQGFIQLQSIQEKPWEFYSVEIKLCESAYTSPKYFKTQNLRRLILHLKLTCEIL